MHHFTHHYSSVLCVSSSNFTSHSTVKHIFEDLIHLIWNIKIHAIFAINYKIIKTATPTETRSRLVLLTLYVSILSLLVSSSHTHFHDLATFIFPVQRGSVHYKKLINYKLLPCRLLHARVQIQRCPSRKQFSGLLSFLWLVSLQQF